MDSKAFTQYRQMEVELRKLREQKKDEEDIIERMSEVWWKLTEKERSILDSEGSTCFPVKIKKDQKEMYEALESLSCGLEEICLGWSNFVDDDFENVVRLKELKEFITRSDMREAMEFLYKLSKDI